VDYEIWLP
jgi:hypothetical protein